MNNWKETTLGEVAEFSNGRTSPERFNSGKYEVFGSNGVIGLSDEINSDANTIIIGRVGSYCGSLYFSKNKCWVTDNAIKANAKENSDPFYLYYLLITQKLNSKAAGSGQPLINQEILNSIEVTCPPLPEQKAIAAILSSFDDKIELLRRQNKTLEQIAETIFKEWFVNFTVNGKKLKLNSKTGLPEGWRMGKLGDEVETVLGGTPKTDIKEYWQNGTIPWINSGKINDFRVYEPTSYITEEALNSSATKIMPNGTVVIAITGATLGQVSRLEIDCSGNQSIIGIVPNKKIPSVYLYYWTLEHISNIISSATGGAQQHINKNNVNDYELLLPNEETMSRFFLLANPLMEKISANCFQIQILSRLRDALLPKLMKGEIRVKT